MNTISIKTIDWLSRYKIDMNIQDSEICIQWWKFSGGGAMFPDGGGGYLFFSWLGTVGQVFVSFPRQMYKFSPTAELALPDKGAVAPPSKPPFGATTVCIMMLS